MDAYLLLVEVGARPDIKRTHVVNGLGAYRHQPFARNTAHAYYEILLAEAKTGQIIAARNGHMYGAKKTEKLIYPAQFQEDGDWADTADEMTEAQRLQLQNRLRGLLIRSIRDTLVLMKLADNSNDSPETPAN